MDMLFGQRGERRGNERLKGHTKIGLLTHVRIMPPASDNRAVPVECRRLPLSRVSRTRSRDATPRAAQTDHAKRRHPPTLRTRVSAQTRPSRPQKPQINTTARSRSVILV
jgi:hypothetical protein